MIHLSGDLHGGSSAYHVSSSMFRPAKRGDIVLCCGDFGGVWWPDYHTNIKHKRDEDYFLESKLRQRVMWLAVDGNHENFARIFSGEFQEVEIFGGKAYKIRDNIFYLKRGEVFTIEGQTFFAFGGATSFDKDPYVTRPASLYGRPERHKGRTEGIDWWPEEVPSQQDFDNALKNLEKASWRVNHVLTHTCPTYLVREFMGNKPLGPRVEDPVSKMLEEIAGRLSFDSWHFGHFHTEQAAGKFHCHYGKPRELSEYLVDQEEEWEKNYEG